MSADDQNWAEFDDDALQDLILPTDRDEIIFQVFKPSQAAWKNFEWMHGGGNVVRVVGPHIKKVLSYIDENVRRFECRKTVEIRDRKRFGELYIIFPITEVSDGRTLYDGAGFDQIIDHFSQPGLYPPVHVINPEYFKREDRV